MTNLRILILVLCTVALYACSHNELNEPTIAQQSSKPKDSISTRNEPYCSYTQIKGIAEVKGFNKARNELYFTFLPGEVDFHIATESLYQDTRYLALEKGSEIKASYAKPQKGNHSDCPKSIPEIFLNE